ncbi:hypothetical protein DdX_18923 [Ditylenchus destructor]|uniref:F-box domain-containing protein n=1 Tax=Ditylenchus destructor TaxID=166010 RepID=A0AAD4MIS1_9BILA|nr:hypothetical protein DdX_18923 [Ditylenchus destructor]
MSCSKPLPPFTYDLLCYLNRDQLERFSIICRPLKNIIDRYFHSKPYRIFDFLHIRGGSYALDGKTCSINIPFRGYSYYSFAEMRPYLGPTVRIKTTYIYVAEGSTFNPEHIEQMESIAYLWRDGDIDFQHANSLDNQIVVKAECELSKLSELILNSPTILKCRELHMNNVHFSFKDYKVLYSVNCIEMFYWDGKEIDTNSWLQFLEQPGVKPVVALHYEDIENLLDRLSKDFCSAVSPNAFKILFCHRNGPLTEFREVNNISGEKLELKKGIPAEWQKKYLKKFNNFTLERSSI